MPASDLYQLPAALPWDTPTYLLLDGISVEKLPQRLYEWLESPDFDVLYLDTAWAELSDVSPCLVRLRGPQDPALAAFLQNGHEEWGYLLFSRASRDALLSHLRWLVCVRHPSGEEMLLRLADPAVIHGLLEQTVQGDDAALFGPVERIIAGDRIEGVWHQHQRSGSVDIAHNNSRYQLSEAQLESLGDVAFRGIVVRLDQHMHEYFPDYQQTLSQAERWQHLRGLAEEAYASGFYSEHDITLYANVFGLLGVEVLHTHTDIAALLSQPSPLTPTQRIEQAADMAYARAQAVERIP